MPATLVEAAAALDDELFEQLLRVRAGRRAPKVGADESALLARINAGPPADVWPRYRELQARRDVRSLSADEHAELTRLTDVVEQYQAERTAALSDLATLRGQTLPQLMTTLGISDPASV